MDLLSATRFFMRTQKTVESAFFDSTLAITALSVADCPRDCCHLLRGRARPPEAGPLASGKYPQVVVERGPARFQASHRDRRRRPGSDLNGTRLNVTRTVDTG